MRDWTRRGKKAARFLMILGVPYLPLASALVPDSKEVALSTDELLMGLRVSCGPAGDCAPGSPRTLSPAEVRRRSRAWEVRRLGEAGWRLLVAPRCAVRADLPLEELRTVAAHAEAFATALDEALGMEGNGRVTVRVFRDRHAFDVYASVLGAKGADSFYDPRSGEAVIWRAEEGLRRRLLMHELTHAFLDRFFGRRDPLWLVEGLAEYFSGGPARPTEELKVPLATLLAAEREEFYGERRELYYAGAESLVRLLASRPESLRRLVRGEPIERACDLRELEGLWLARLKESTS